MTGDPKIMIAVSTLDRVAGLMLLMRAFERQVLNPLPDHAVSLVVVDNSLSGSARLACAEHVVRSRFALTYRHEPRRGLSFARNIALQAAQDVSATHLAFIDDDELPDPRWLGHLYARLQNSGAAAAIGPVHPLFEAMPPRWAVGGGFFAKKLPEKSGLLTDGYTSNALVDLDLIRRHAIQFDARCNATGGEDTLFFRALQRHGGRIVPASSAIVYEMIPASRATVSWLFRRWFRTGSTEAQLGDVSPDSLAGRVYNLMRGLGRLGAALARIAFALPGAWSKPERLVQAFYTLCRGAGLIASAVGYRYAEYAPAIYRPQ